MGIAFFVAGQNIFQFTPMSVMQDKNCTLLLERFTLMYGSLTRPQSIIFTGNAENTPFIPSLQAVRVQSGRAQLLDTAARNVLGGSVTSCLLKHVWERD